MSCSFDFETAATTVVIPEEDGKEQEERVTPWLEIRPANAS